MRRFLRPGITQNGRRRKAAAIVEFAVVLPLLLTMLFGIIEFGWLFMIRQTLVNAAREGCRVAVLRTATSEDVAARIREVMEPLGFQEDTDWWFTHSDLDQTVQTVHVEASLENVSLTGGYVVQDAFELFGDCSMRKEGAVAGEDEVEEEE